MNFPQQLFLRFTGLFAEKPQRTPACPVLVPFPRSAKLKALRGLDPALTETAQSMTRRLRGLRELADRVTVIWNPRLQTTAGTANPRRWEIELNPRLKEHRPSVLNRILRHELAHLVSVYRSGRRRIQAHGPEWRKACADLGIPGELRCHSLPFQGRKTRHKFAYRCQHCGRLLKRVKALERRSACYDCCQKHNKGRYDARYRYVRVPLEALNEAQPIAV